MSDRSTGRTLRRMHRVLAVGGMMALLAPRADVAAQSAAEYRRRLDSLEPQWLAARADVEAKERARRTAARAVVVERGPLRLIVDSSLLPVVMEPASVAADELVRTFGGAADALADHRFIVREKYLGRRGADSVRTIMIGVEGREHSSAFGDSAENRYRVLSVLRGSQVTAILHAKLDDSLRTWFRAPLQAGVETPAERERAYVWLVTASTDVSRLCLAGDLVGCRKLLGLAPVHDPLMEGHTAVQRRALVLSHSARLRTAAHTREYDRCVANHDDAACIARLRTLPVDVFIRSMANVDTHRSFARFVLERGGAGAYDRLRASTTLPLDARFGAAGGAPADTLVAAWRAGIIAARPSRTPVTPITAFATLAWIAAGAVLALRSSRWR